MITHEQYLKIKDIVDATMREAPFNNEDWQFRVCADTGVATIWQKDREIIICLHNYVNIDSLYPSRLTDLSGNGLAALAAAQRKIQAVFNWVP